MGCAVKSCRASYHYPCGVENKCFYRFHGSFESFCPDHIPAKQFARPKDTKNVKKECVICLDEPDLKDKFDTLVTPCCNRALHRECLAGHAVNAGKHFLKCPSCNMVDNFKSFCEQVRCVKVVRELRKFALITYLQTDVHDLRMVSRIQVHDSC